jgi:hypothetical protein
MPPYVVSLIGLLLDIIGVALLSVEAIKLENLRKLRDRFLKPMHEYAKPMAVTLTDAPNEPPNPKLRYRRTMFDGCVWWALTHTGTGALTLWLVWVGVRSHIPGLLPWVVGQWQITGTFGRWTAGLIGAWLLFVLATGIGEGYHYTTIWLTKRLVDVADFIDARTPDGTIGVIGFVTVAVGFLLQFVGTWLGRPR